MAIKRTGSAVWNGGLKDGKGTVSTSSGVLMALTSIRRSCDGQAAVRAAAR